MVVDPLVSVCLITYNHHGFIREAIESVLGQNVDFSWEFIIADDFSTDGTREILIEYQNKYPAIIRLILQEKNVGAGRNWFDLISAPRGKYIAYFEGDDYWTHKNKLQKQVDFLEANPDFAFCFHRVNTLMQNNTFVLQDSGLSDKEEIYTLNDLAKGNFIFTSSVVYRSNLFDKFPDWVLQSKVGDYVLHMLNAKKGKIKYFPEPMTVYRMHNNSMWASKTDKFKYTGLMDVIDNLIKEFEDYETVCSNLEYQFAINASLLAEVYYNESDYDQYVQHVKMAFDKSPAFMKDWLLNNRRDPKSVSKSVTAAKRRFSLRNILRYGS